jgi:hypothetical protein
MNQAALEWEGQDSALGWGFQGLRGARGAEFDRGWGALLDGIWGWVEGAGEIPGDGVNLRR